MSELRIETADGRTSFAPGEALEATAEWQLDNQADAVELRLAWSTRGDGERDMSIVERVRFESPERVGTRRWTVQLPNGPYSFSGSRISLVWALELVVEPAGNTQALDITVAPHGKEILLHSQTESA